MRLNDPLVTSFNYKGTEYDIDMAFDNVLDVFDILGNEELLMSERVELSLRLLLDEQDYPVAVEFWNHIYETFIHKEAEEHVERDLEGNPMPTEEGDNESYIDLEQDAKYIYSSFIEAYGIDLFDEQSKMHWQKFQSLLIGLPSETIMQRIIQIRSWEPDKNDSAEYVREMRKLQATHSLHKKMEEVDE